MLGWLKVAHESVYKSKRNKVMPPQALGANMTEWRSAANIERKKTSMIKVVWFIVLVVL
jgi:hypothetical protein